MNQKPHHKITLAAKRRFQIWLLQNNMSLNQFAKNVGVTHQYISLVLNGKRNITTSVRELFKKGGYELL